MTNREFYTAIANFATMDTETLAKFDFTEIATVAADALAKMDAANEKRRNTPSKKAMENAPLCAEIATLLTTEAQTATDIAAQIGVSTQKASALLRSMVATGTANVQDVKIPSKGTQKGYTAVDTAVESDAE